MARKSRQYGKSGIYHIIIRGNNQQNIFLDDEDRNFILNRIEKFTSQLKIDVYAYCIMNNHVHLLIGNGNKNMSKFMLKLNTSYARKFNIKYERTGHVFQGRYLSKPIERDEELKIVLRYILKNPDKAKIAKYDNYIWNSFSEIKNYEQKFEKLDDKISRKKGIKIKSKIIIDLFGCRNSFLNYMNQTDNDNVMEYEGKIRFNDEHCREIIQKILELDNLENLKFIDIKDLKEKIHMIKNNGISINQISRITGISRKIIRLI